MSSVWAPPSAQEYPAQPSTPVDALMNRIRKLEGLVAELTKGSPLRQAGMGVSPGQIDFDGNVVISGTLSLPAGIIDNAALASPASFVNTGGGQSNFDVPEAGVLVAQQTLAVPAGYSRAIVLALASAAARNTTAAAAFLYVGAQIGTVAPNVTWALAQAGSYANASASATRLMTGLAGGVINVAVRASTQGATWTATSSMANLDAIAIFLR